MTGGNSFGNSLSLLGSSPVAADLGVELGFIDKYPLPILDLAYFLLVRLALLLDPRRVLLLGVDRLFLDAAPSFPGWSRWKTGCCAGVLLAPAFLQFLQREIGLALQPTAQPFPDRRGKLGFASGTVRDTFGLARFSLVGDKFPYITNCLP